MPGKFLFVFLLFSVVLSEKAFSQKEFQVKEAKQAVAVDKGHFYVINNSTIHKYTKADGKLVQSWDGSERGIKHLNSGVVIKGKLYCANSNYPEIPMASAVEIFDAKTLQHIGNHSFGINNHGSLTWLDQKDGFWYIGFAHYGGKEASEGRDVRWTSFVKYTLDWKEVESWIFPKNIVELFTPKSNSGGALGGDGLLYLTGHDRPEIYVMKIPSWGYTLEYVKTIPVGIHGQGIAIDRIVKDRVVVYGINRAESTVVVEDIK
ncbi:hypothetical protein [Dyadobacter sp. CY312]|uniref:hypothetical protein n=1 Tax=Dyadobacter sp. CY312 TaxID=2907303 RepID=UPI001F2A270B|nr:hypothetical protein [Dyadobacter sp. CY312]MCE7042343.1 hypothetical protein [Dyadobacter sp. CY312]